MNKLSEIREVMEQVVLDAGDQLLSREQSRKIYQKGYADFVTEVDLHVEKMVRQVLTEKFPEIQFMGEEEDNTGLDLSQAVWILDPVDGTTNLIRDMRMSVISLALVYNRRAVAGVIYHPYTKELFSAAKGQGTRLNGNPITVSGKKTAAECLIGLGTSPYHQDLARPTMEAAAAVFASCMDIRRSGSAAADLAYIAAGRLDGMFEMILQPWDVAAGRILIEEAGGTMTDMTGADFDITRPGSILATNGTIHREMVQLLMPFRK